MQRRLQCRVIRHSYSDRPRASRVRRHRPTGSDVTEWTRGRQVLQQVRGVAQKTGILQSKVKRIL